MKTIDGIDGWVQKYHWNVPAVTVGCCPGQVEIKNIGPHRN